MNARRCCDAFLRIGILKTAVLILHGPLRLGTYSSEHRNSRSGVVFDSPPVFLSRTPARFESGVVAAAHRLIPIFIEGFHHDAKATQTRCALGCPGRACRRMSHVSDRFACGSAIATAARSATTTEPESSAESEPQSESAEPHDSPRTSDGIRRTASGIERRRSREVQHRPHGVRHTGRCRRWTRARLQR
jgi:hypothetical protein